MKVDQWHVQRLSISHRGNCIGVAVIVPGGEVLSWPVFRSTQTGDQPMRTAEFTRILEPMLLPRSVPPTSKKRPQREALPRNSVRTMMTHGPWRPASLVPGDAYLGQGTGMGDVLGFAEQFCMTPDFDRTSRIGEDLQTMI